MKQFGTVKYDESKAQWIIECEPHVSLRLKRVFANLNNHSYGTHKISATEENTRDLEWFIGRYPMSMDECATKLIKELSDEHRKTEKFVTTFYKGDAKQVSSELAKPAREYQKEAATLFLRMKSLLLADDVGLGKTVSFIASLNENTLPALVVVLAHLPRQWEDMIKEFAPNLTTHIIKQGQFYNFKQPDVTIINYHKLSKWAEFLAPRIKTVCFDECQELRRSESDKYKASEHISSSSEFKIGLSATPIYNYGGEFYNVINVLSPNKLGTFEEFMREWCVGYFDPRKARIENAFEILREAQNNIEIVFTDNVHFGFEYTSESSPKKLIEETRKSIWHAIIGKTEIHRFLTKKRIDELSKNIETGEIGEVTTENVLNIFRSAAANIPSLLEEKVVECFNILHPCHSKYKNNEKFSNELGKRVVLSHKVSPKWSGGGFHVNTYHQDDVRAIANSFRLLDGKAEGESYYGELYDAIEASEGCFGETEYFKFRCYGNGNLHLEFKRMDLVQKMNAIVTTNVLKRKN